MTKVAYRGLSLTWQRRRKMVYLLYGEETYLLEAKLKKLKKEFGEAVKGINFIQIDAENISEIISDIETPAFGYSTKLIIARNTGLFKKEKKAAKGKSKKTEATNSLEGKIADYMMEHKDILEEDVTLIFVEETVEKNSLYKAIEAVGEITNFEPLKLPQIVENIRKICSLYKVNIGADVAKYFVECCGTNMQDLINEIRKLIEYVGPERNNSKRRY